MSWRKPELQNRWLYHWSFSVTAD